MCKNILKFLENKWYLLFGVWVIVVWVLVWIEIFVKSRMWIFLVVVVGFVDLESE